VITQSRSAGHVGSSCTLTRHRGYRQGGLDENSVRDDRARGDDCGCHWGSGDGLGLRGATAVLSQTEAPQGVALVCWFNRHWWRHLSDDWGVRKCRVCKAKEQAMYDAITGTYWVRL
jgi:hypothetical protein